MNTSLGRYTPFNTLVHRIDARVKLIGFILMMVSIFLSYGTGYMTLIIYGGIFLILLVLSLIGKASFLNVFRQLKALWLMIFFLLIINIFFSNNPDSDVLFHIGDVAITMGAVINVSKIFLRLVLVLMMTNIFTSTTKPLEMTSALEWLFYPLKYIKIPIHTLAMALSLALRFIPTLQEETSRIMKAQASRGVDFKQGKFKEKVKSLISLIIPLFMSALTTSGELADAMEARGYDPNSERTKYKTTHWGLKDTLSCVFLALFLSGMIVLAYFKFDLFEALNITLPRL